MNHKKIIQIDANGACFHEFEACSKEPIALSASLMDVTDRTDGPFLGKIYDLKTDTFADPPPPPEETQEEGDGQTGNS